MTTATEARVTPRGWGVPGHRRVEAVLAACYNHYVQVGLVGCEDVYGSQLGTSEWNFPMLHKRRTASRTARSLLLSTLLTAAVFPRPAFAYIDPGTTQTVWTSLAPLLSILVACVAMLLLPFRYLLGRARSLWAGWSARKKWVVLGGAVALLVAAVVGVSVYFFGAGSERPIFAGERRKVSYKRVLILGLDGMDPGILERMMNAGQLPTLPSCARKERLLLFRPPSPRKVRLHGRAPRPA